MDYSGLVDIQMCKYFRTLMWFIEGKEVHVIEFGLCQRLYLGHLIE